MPWQDEPKCGRIRRPRHLCSGGGRLRGGAAANSHSPATMWLGAWCLSNSDMYSFEASDLALRSAPTQKISKDSTRPHFMNMDRMGRKPRERRPVLIPGAGVDRHPTRADDGGLGRKHSDGATDLSNLEFGNAGATRNEISRPLFEERTGAPQQADVVSAADVPPNRKTRQTRQHVFFRTDAKMWHRILRWRGGAPSLPRR